MRIIAGSYKNKSLQTPKGFSTRPTSNKLRAALFNICQQYIEGASFLDLFAGSGAMGLEALSRGAKEAVFVDNSRESAHCIQENLHLLKAEEKGEVICHDALKAIHLLEKRGRQFDIIYADPPYEQDYGSKVVDLIDRGSLLSENGQFFIEESKKFSPDQLSNLEIISIRRMGRSMLQQYARRPK